MKTYSIYHGMDDEQKQPLGLAVFDDAGYLERVDDGDDDQFSDALRDHDTVHEMAKRYKMLQFIPEGGTS